MATKPVYTLWADGRRVANLSNVYQCHAKARIWCKENPDKQGRFTVTNRDGEELCHFTRATIPA